MTKYLDTSEKCYHAIIENAKRSKKEILLCYFSVGVSVMFSNLADVLIERARSGVKVKLLVDDVGAMFKLPLKYKKALETLGIEIKRFNGLFKQSGINKFCRLHIKTAVFDGERCVYGGLNLGDEYVNIIEKCGHWKESGFFTDEKCVKEIRKDFFDLWNEKPVAEKREDNGYFVNGERLRFKRLTNRLSEALREAKKSIVIATPYFVPPYKTLCDLISASLSGVKVTLIIPGRPDKRAVYALTLLYADILRSFGAEIKRYGRGFIHQKTVLSDGERAFVGSMNIDYGSFYNNIESCAEITDEKFVKSVGDDLKNILSESVPFERECTLKEKIAGFLIFPFKKFC